MIIIGIVLKVNNYIFSLQFRRSFNWLDFGIGDLSPLLQPLCQLIYEFRMNALSIEKKKCFLSNTSTTEAKIIQRRIVNLVVNIDLKKFQVKLYLQDNYAFFLKSRVT